MVFLQEFFKKSWLWKKSADAKKALKLSKGAKSKLDLYAFWMGPKALKMLLMCAYKSMTVCTNHDCSSWRIFCDISLHFQGRRYTQNIKPYLHVVSLNDQKIKCPLLAHFACWEIFHDLLLSADFFKVNFFEKKSFRNTFMCQTVWIQIWILTICKDHQEASPVGKELRSTVKPV